MSEARHLTRPWRARRRWLEDLDVGEVRVKLSCVVEDDKIVVTNIDLPHGGFERR